MAVPIVQPDIMIDRPDGPHLDAADVARYVDGQAPPDLRARVQSHMAHCAECRDEVLEVLRTAPPRTAATARRVWVPAIAAAAVLVIAVWPRGERVAPNIHREGAITATIAPRAIAPSGVTRGSIALTWAQVPNADRYVARVFDGRGDVVWERQTNDTTIPVPDSIVRLNEPYFWKVDAHTGFGRSVSSDLTEFTRARSNP